MVLILFFRVEALLTSPEEKKSTHWFRFLTVFFFSVKSIFFSFSHMRRSTLLGGVRTLGVNFPPIS